MAQITLNSSGVASNGTLKLQSNGTTDAVTIDTAQNLGLGVTPSAWGSPFKAFQFGSNGGSLNYRTDSNQAVELALNWFYDGTNSKYINSNWATRYRQFSGAHEWYTAASGTAGANITFTQAMTLDAGTNLLLNATSLDSSLGSSITQLYMVGKSTSRGGGIRLRSSDASQDGCVYLADGSMFVGTISSHPLVLQTGNTERARIDTSGNLLVGTTSGSQHRFYKNVQSDQAVYIINTNATDPYGAYINYSAASPNSTGAWFLNCADSTASRFIFRSNGGLANYSANNVNLSDRREKTNFAPAGDYLAKICAIPVQTFNYIDQNIDEDDGLTLGVVAQDVQAVAPELVMESNWGTKEEPKMRLSIYQTDLQYALMKALQELKAEFDAYKASHP